MHTDRALVIALEPFIALDDVPTRLPHDVARVVADHAAVGYRLLPIARIPHAVVNALNDNGDVTSLGDHIRRAVRTQVGARVLDPVWLFDSHDPRPLWDAARRYELRLHRSILLTDGAAHAGVCRTAGIGRVAGLRELQHVLVAA